MATTKRWWQYPGDPNTVGVEETVTNADGDVVGVSGVMQNDFVEITEAEYDAIMARRDTAPDRSASIDAVMAADRAAYTADAVAAHADLIAIGASADTATFLTGYVPGP